MDFIQDFINSLQTNPSFTKTTTIYNYLPIALNKPLITKDALPYLQAYGNIETCFPYHYELAQLDSYCILFTESGSGYLTIDDHRYMLAHGTFAFINCKEKHRIEIKHSPWNYKVIFVNGNPIPFLHGAFDEQYHKVHTFSDGSNTPHLIRKLFDHLEKSTEKNYIQAKFILDIILEIMISGKKSEENTMYIPEYLIKIKHDFDYSFEKKFTLDELESDYHISKYQICREFTAQYGSSPIKYLNNIRIEKAKETLIHTTIKINEVGRMVGFENTNHFIRLFKQQTGVTPLIFRKQPPVFTLTL